MKLKKNIIILFIANSNESSSSTGTTTIATGGERYGDSSAISCLIPYNVSVSERTTYSYSKLSSFADDKTSRLRTSITIKFYGQSLGRCSLLFFYIDIELTRAFRRRYMVFTLFDLFESIEIDHQCGQLIVEERIKLPANMRERKDAVLFFLFFSFRWLTLRDSIRVESCLLRGTMASCSQIRIHSIMSRICASEARYIRCRERERESEQC